MRNPIRLVAVVALLGLGVACADPAPPVAPASSTVTEPPTDLGGARAAWSAADVGAYALRVKTRCFCAGADYRIEVDDEGVPQSAAPEDYLPETVEDLHDILAKAYDGNAATVDVTFDEYGVPTHIYIDRDENTMDEEMTYEVRFEDVP